MKWIPVSEGLPKKEGTYWVYREIKRIKGYPADYYSNHIDAVYMQIWKGEKRWLLGCRPNDILYWSELPERPDKNILYYGEKGYERKDMNSYSTEIREDE